MKNKIVMTMTLIFVLVLMVGMAEGQVDYDKIYQNTAKKWTRSAQVEDAFSVEALFWNEEVVQAWVAKYGKENLLSAEEELAYHRDFLQRERMNRYLVFEVTIKKLKGAPLYPMKFAQNTYLVDDRGNKFYPLEFPPEFEEKIFDKVTGKIYFPRFDKEGNPIINPDTRSITLHLARISIDPKLIGKEINLTWDNPYLPPDYSRPEWKPVLEEEILRLEERVKELELQKRMLEDKIKGIDNEIEEVKAKIKDLQKEQ
ncbi:MAG TPA: hypothetical protein PK016_06485 [Candidatus Atribacteria bacterium]|nr:hypothetical protein [Candidatus Atribacteria bacterium]